MKSFVHTNYPIRVCSLTTGSSGSWSSVCRSVVTKSRDGKVVTDGLSDSQSGKANQQVAGKRTTEGIVKVTRLELLSEAGLGGVECAFNARRPLSAGKKLDVTCGSPGVKGGDMLKEDSDATGEIPCDQRASVVNRSIRRNAESWSDVAWEVGDVHSSEDTSATETALCEGTLACRSMRCNEVASGECVKTLKNTHKVGSEHYEAYYIASPSGIMEMQPVVSANAESSNAKPTEMEKKGFDEMNNYPSGDKRMVCEERQGERDRKSVV